MTLASWLMLSSQLAAFSFPTYSETTSTESFCFSLFNNNAYQFMLVSVSLRGISQVFTYGSISLKVVMPFNASNVPS